MKLKLSENIKAYRKRLGFTQEQLAEILGVSSGAVHKWEAALSVPDISLIAAMSELFNISIDALLGHVLTLRNEDEISERIKLLRSDKSYENAMDEARSALGKYPNSFAVLYRCGELYQTFGIERDDEGSVRYAIQLFKRALAALPQNKDPDIGEANVTSNIAECYLALGKADKAIELFKSNNYAGIHNGDIGMTYSNLLHMPEAAQPYLSRAFADYMQGILRIMLGYTYSYLDLSKTAKAKQTLLWLVSFIDSLREESSSVTYLDKIKAVLLAILSTIEDDDAKVEGYLKDACRLALLFDASPVYSTKGVMFCENFDKTVTLYDSLGKSALEAVEKIIYDKDGKEYVSEKIISVWEKIKNEKE